MTTSIKPFDPSDLTETELLAIAQQDDPNELFPSDDAPVGACTSEAFKAIGLKSWGQTAYQEWNRLNMLTVAHGKKIDLEVEDQAPEMIEQLLQAIFEKANAGTSFALGTSMRAQLISPAHFIAVRKVDSQKYTVHHGFRNDKRNTVWSRHWFDKTQQYRLRRGLEVMTFGLTTERMNFKIGHIIGEKGDRFAVKFQNGNKLIRAVNLIPYIQTAGETPMEKLTLEKKNFILRATETMAPEIFKDISIACDRPFEPGRVMPIAEMLFRFGGLKTLSIEEVGDFLKSWMLFSDDLKLTGTIPMTRQFGYFLTILNR